MQQPDPNKSHVCELVKNKTVTYEICIPGPEK